MKDHKWRCPRCFRWVRERMGRCCQRCNVETYLLENEHDLQSQPTSDGEGYGIPPMPEDSIVGMSGMCIGAGENGALSCA